MTPILQLIDRLLNSSTPSDALDSIREIIESIQQHADKKEKEQDGDEEEKEPPVLSLVSTLIESHDFMISLCSILSENQFRSSSSSSRALTLEGGSSVICELLLTILAVLVPPSSSSKEDVRSLPISNTLSSNNNQTVQLSATQRKHRIQILKQLLKPPSEGRSLIHSLLDVISPSAEDEDTTGSDRDHPPFASYHPLYARISAIQVLDQFVVILPSFVHAQILSAPNGTHRILSLVSSTGGQSMDESDEEIQVIRNQAILLCTTLVRTSSACARLFIFSEMYERILLGIAVPELHRYATQKNIHQVDPTSLILVCDCLQLCLEMTFKDSMGCKVFLESKTLLHALCAMLDLRLGIHYRFPRRQQQQGQTSSSSSMKHSHLYYARMIYSIDSFLI